jgi:hypothetical protein
MQRYFLHALKVVMLRAEKISHVRKIIHPSHADHKMDVVIKENCPPTELGGRGGGLLRGDKDFVVLFMALWAEMKIR